MSLALGQRAAVHALRDAVAHLLLSARDAALVLGMRGGQRQQGGCREGGCDDPGFHLSLLR
ncbi:hypothetical protein NCCP691_01960 [Noviherbaspirillum aridicola]|uniref:Uncharacterized protein n=1 Tax=Noviherbaspirillum aridicola TaxID=2849687 RepID=A0ABQ4PZK2_9BURK|nr:hypothetical protein NCCP691_01960 [Noviherbaspirillum aridicola]